MLLIAALALGAIAVGCGADEDEGGGEATSAAGTGVGSESNSQAGGNGQSGGAVEASSLSKEEFVKQANAACKRESKDLFAEINAYFAKNQTGGSEEERIAKTIKATMAPVVEAEIAVVRELGAPAGDEAEVEAMLAAQEAGLERLARLKRAKDLGSGEALFGEGAELLRAYGLEDCVAGFS